VGSMSLDIITEPSPYNGQPAIPYMACPCGRKLRAHLGHVRCPDCGRKYAPDGTPATDAAWEAAVSCPCCVQQGTQSGSVAA